MPGDSSRLREARVAAGLSQAALAGAAGISRQMVGAIEAGRHRPSVDAALGLAGSVGWSVEALFGAGGQTCEPVLGAPAPDGAPVLAARIGDRVCYAAARHALAMDGWPAANAVMRRGRPRPLPGADLDGLLLVGCDPALALAAALLPAAGPRHVIALSGSTAAALEAMRLGRAHAAVVHGPVARLPAAPGGALRLHLARWRVGVASRGRRARSVAELLGRKARVVQREPGASSQKAFLAAVASEGGSAAAGPIASGHIEVAQRVAYGAAAGVTMEPAALSRGLAFAALEEHTVEVWIDARRRDHPSIAALADTLRSPAFTHRLGLVGGYELADCGSQVGVAA